MTDLPYELRPSDLEERRSFYRSFDLGPSSDWVGRDPVYAVIIGRHTGIYPERYEGDHRAPLVIDDYRDGDEVVDWVLEFLPEGLYYDRNHYADRSLCHDRDLRDVWDWDNFEGQQLAFDVDPENVDCPDHGTLEERLSRGEGLSFCERAFDISREHTVELHYRMAENYSDVRTVFSGRGFHVHVMDRDARELGRRERRLLADENGDLAIDGFVTEGEMRLMRLPYSLNGSASRVVLPLDPDRVLEIDPSSEALPDFL